MPDRKFAASGDGSDLFSLCFPCGYTNKSQIINIRSAIVGLPSICFICDGIEIALIVNYTYLLSRFQPSSLKRTKKTRRKGTHS